MAGEESDDLIRLVLAAQRQDRAAFAELHARFARTVHGILLAHASRTDVDDLVQDVFLQAMTRIRDLREPAAFGGWLVTIARRRAIDHVRRATYPRTTDLPADLPASSPDRTNAIAVLTMVRSLPEAYRETLILRLVEGMTGPEIAVRTGLTEGSVRVNLHRGMKLLRERMERSVP